MADIVDMFVHKKPSLTKLLYHVKHVILNVDSVLVRLLITVLVVIQVWY